MNRSGTIPELVIESRPTTVTDRLHMEAHPDGVKVWLTGRDGEGAFTMLSIDDVARIERFLRAWTVARDVQARAGNMAREVPS